MQRWVGGRAIPLLVAAASAALLLGAYLSQHVGGLAPCPLCLIQRYPHFAVFGLGLAAAVVAGGRARMALLALSGLALLVTAGYGVYHVGVEQGWFASSCAAPMSGGTIEDIRAQVMAAPLTRCDEVPWSLIGVSLAGWNAIASVAVAALAALGAARLVEGARMNDQEKREEAGPAVTGEDRLPGDPAPEETIARMIRVDHAGEYGAKRIYDGQLAVLGRSGAAPAIREMAEAEQAHLDTFDTLLVERRVRPTALSPVWHVAGYALGAASALLGERAAMACTVAVEEVIEQHYAAQAQRLGEDEAELRRTLEEFGADEARHRATGLAHGAERAPGYEALGAAVKRGTRLAIWLSERI